MSMLSFGLLVVLLMLMALFYTDAFRERICTPMVRWIVARRRAAAMRQLGERS